MHKKVKTKKRKAKKVMYSKYDKETEKYILALAAQNETVVVTEVAELVTAEGIIGTFPEVEQEEK